MSTEAIRLIRNEGKRVCKLIRREYYLNYSGQKSKTEITEIFKSHRDLVEQEVFESLKNTRTNSEQEANGIKSMLSFLAENILLSRSAKLVHNILEIEGSSAYTIDGKRVPFRESLKILLSKSKNEEIKEIHDKSGAILAKLNELYLRQYAYLQKDSHDIGFANYLELYEYTENHNTSELVELAKEFIRDTEYISRELLNWFMLKKMDLELKDANTDNLFYILNSFELKEFFPKINTHKIAQAILEENKINLPAKIMFDTENRKGHIMGSIPYIMNPGAEMLISTNLMRSVFDYESFLYSFGYCLCYGFTNIDDYFEYTHLREKTANNIFAIMFKNLIYEPMWLKKHLRIDSDADFLKFLYLRRLIETRIIAAKVIYEAALYSKEDDKKEIFRDIMKVATHCDPDTQNYLYDIRPHLSSLDKFKAMLIETKLREHMVDNYDEQWWRNEMASELLIKTWETGGRTSANMLSQEYALGHPEITYLLKTFEKQLG